MARSTQTFERLEASARKRPDSGAIVHQEQCLSYNELFRAAGSFADHLEQEGFDDTALVGLTGHKDVESVIAFLGLLCRGNPVITLSPGLQSNELAALAERLSLKALCRSRKAEANARIEQTASKNRSAQSHWDGLECTSLRDFSAMDGRSAELARRRITNIRLSSGTTGEAKGIMNSEDATWWRAERNSQMHQVTAGDCILYIVSMDLASPHLIAYFAQGAQVIVEEAHHFDAIRQLSATHRITHVHATPLFYQMMLTAAELTGDNFPGVRLFISTGAPLSAQIADAFQRKFGREISQYYGLGECGPVFVNVSRDPCKRGATGRLLEGWEIRLVDQSSPDSQECGELFLRGPGLFEGYYEPWRLREEILEDGWFRTGDLVRRDADGYYWVIGRSKEVINIGGNKLFPAEVEAILLGHGDVEEAMVYGQRDSRFGEVPCAKIKRRLGASVSERDLMRFVNERLSILKALRKIEFVSELPRTLGGKIKRPFS